MKYLLRFNGYENIRRQLPKGEYCIYPQMYQKLFVNPKVEKVYNIIRLKGYCYNSDNLIINGMKPELVVVRRHGGSVSDTILLNYFECEENQINDIINRIKEVFDNVKLHNYSVEYVKSYNPKEVIKFDMAIDIQLPDE